MVVLVRAPEYDETVSAKSVVLVDFYADWCGPCRVIAPMLEEFETELHNSADDMKDKVAFVKVNVDQSADLAAKMEVSAMPTFIVYKDGAVADTIVGANPVAVRKAVNNALGLAEPEAAPEVVSVVE